MEQFLFAALSAPLLFFASCKKKDDTQLNLAGTFNGASHAMGAGKVYSWATTDAAGHPTAFGFTFNDAALTGLPANGSSGGHSHETSFELDLPAQAAQTPFRQFVIDWNPQGHEPTAIYGAPHFDFHCYTMGELDRMSIPPYETDSSGFLQVPGVDYLPAGYFNPGGGVPMMGCHWLDATSPELNGKPFTETFIYGTYKGTVTFIESMITMDYLRSTTDYGRAVPRPAKVKVSGYYPARYRITHAAGQYTLTFDQMEYRTGS